MPGLSADPDKARRQLDGLATANSRLDVDAIIAAREAPPEPPAAPAPAPAAAAPPPGPPPPTTVAGLPVRPASHQEEPVADDPPREPDPEPEPGPGDDAPDPEPEPEGEPSGWRGFFEGLAFG